MTFAENDPDVAALLSRFSERAKHPITLPYLLNSWEEFVREVASGYRMSIYDYTNDLSARDLLAQLMSGITPDRADEIEEVIRPSDAIFRASTTETDRPLLGQDSPERWWWFRIPLKAEDELRNDFRAEGYVVRPTT